MEELLTLVDFNDHVIGALDKMSAHRQPRLHRAFSVFLLDGDRMLLQKRNREKYHSGGKWANACCSHPRFHEGLEEAVHRRLNQELGIDCALRELCSFTYFSKYAEDLYEYELDHVYIGAYRGEVRPNPEEIEEVRWVSLEELEKEMLQQPERFATWFLIAATEVIRYWRRKDGT